MDQMYLQQCHYTNNYGYIITVIDLISEHTLISGHSPFLLY